MADGKKGPSWSLGGVLPQPLGDAFAGKCVNLEGVKQSIATAKMLKIPVCAYDLDPRIWPILL